MKIRLFIMLIVLSVTLCCCSGSRNPDIQWVDDGVFYNGETYYMLSDYAYSFKTDSVVAQSGSFFDITSQSLYTLKYDVNHEYLYIPGMRSDERQFFSRLGKTLPDGGKVTAISLGREVEVFIADSADISFLLSLPEKTSETEVTYPRLRSARFSVEMFLFYEGCPLSNNPFGTIAHKDGQWLFVSSSSWLAHPEDDFYVGNVIDDADTINTIQRITQKISALK